MWGGCNSGVNNGNGQCQDATYPDEVGAWIRSQDLNTQRRAIQRLEEALTKQTRKGTDAPDNGSGGARLTLALLLVLCALDLKAEILKGYPCIRRLNQLYCPTPGNGYPKYVNACRRTAPCTFVIILIVILSKTSAASRKFRLYWATYDKTQLLEGSDSGTSAMAQPCKRPGQTSDPFHTPSKRPDQRAGERNCGDANEPTTVDDASTIVGLDEKVDDWSDMEDDNFKIVSHRKSRTVGIPVIISPVESGKDLRQVNPNALYSAVTSVIDAEPVRSYLTAQGSLLIDVAPEDQVNALFRCDKLCGVAVSARLPNAYLRNTWLIRVVQKWYNEADLLEYTKPQGLTPVRRIVRREVSSTNEWKIRPTDAVVLAFTPNTK
ncbi:hypothetical protein HPB51_029537 [Rhipicephalus microplus]|uniref:Uncharacterized protein n=1 Tax=Rhipicephalus microplus TaxID=6941 RepID=A0A9J6CU19_RHIMP|nr:hypothetical protein HPB51_029537 [Rhipicephalus microplus]